MHYSITLLLVCTAIALAVGGSDLALRVLMRDIPVVTGRRGALVNRTRSTGQQQLQCKGGDASAAAEGMHPDVIQCTNKGWDGATTHWACEAALDARVRLGATQVRCEGWERPGDEYVRLGSCIVDYELVWVAVATPPPPAQPTVDVAALLREAREQRAAAERVIRDMPTLERPDFTPMLIGLGLIALVLIVLICVTGCAPTTTTTVVSTVPAPQQQVVHRDTTTVIEHHAPPPPVVVQQHRVVHDEPFYDTIAGGLSTWDSRLRYRPAPAPPVIVTQAPIVVHTSPAPQRTEVVHHHHSPAATPAKAAPAQQHVSKSFGTGSSD